MNKITENSLKNQAVNRHNQEELSNEFRTAKLVLAPVNSLNRLT